MRFFCDQDVAASVARRLRQLGHEAWTAEEAALPSAGDDTLTVYASKKQAVLITHDKEFSLRRKKNVIGRHVWLNCLEFDGPDVVEKWLPEFIEILARYADVWIRVHQAGWETSHDWK